MSRKPVRIAFISHRVGRDGGIENVVLHLVRHCMDRGDQVAIVADSLPDELQGRVRFERAVFPSWLPWALRIAYFALSSRAACRRLGPGWLLHANVPTAAPAQVAVAHSVHKAGVKAVLAAEPSRRRRWWFRVRTLGPLTDWIAGINWRDPALRVAVALSKGVKSELEANYPGLRGKVRIAPNGFDPARFRPLPAAERTRRRKALGLGPQDVALLFVGKDFHRKGLEFAIRALALLPARVQLWVAGQNGDVVPTSHYTALAEALKVQARTRFLGHQKDVAPFFQACDALVFPTLYEAFAVVSAEAMGAGLPLLACRANGVDDLLVDGVNGAFIRRDGADIAAAVRRWILPAAERRRLAKGALARSRSMHWNKVAALHRRLALQALPS